MAMTGNYPPFIHTRYTHGTLRLGVLIAMFPVAAWGVFMFGARVVTLLAIGIISAAFSEWLYRFASGGGFYGSFMCDFRSPAITGALCAMMCPVSVPLYVPAVASAIAVIVFRNLWGGEGKNLLNPAVAGVVSTELLFHGNMSSFVLPFSYHSATAIIIGPEYIEEVGCRSPLQVLWHGGLYEDGVSSLFLGVCPGKIGEIGIVVLILAAVILLVTRNLKPYTGLSYVVTLFLISYFFPVGENEAAVYALWQVFSGSVIFLAVFAMSDPVTTPKRNGGRVLFGVGCGLLTYVFRMLIPMFDGAYIALLVMNILTPLFFHITTPLPYGVSRSARENDISVTDEGDVAEQVGSEDRDSDKPL